MNAIGFVAAPKVYDTSNPGYYTDGTAWSNTDWESVDLRLLSTSSYATGNSLTSADGDVYDLAGNKRSVGGAVGAYECLSDVTHWSYGLPMWYEITENIVENDGDPTAESPRIDNVTYMATPTASNMNYTNSNISGGSKLSKWLTSTGVWTTPASYTVNYLQTQCNATRRLAFSSDGELSSAWVQLKIKDAPESSTDTPIPSFASQQGWATTAALTARNTTSPSYAASSVCHIGQNKAFRDGAVSVSKIYVPGWTHVDLGNNGGGAEVVLGLGATVTFDGQVVAKNLTKTSADLLAHYQPTTGAKFTLTNCTITD